MAIPSSAPDVTNDYLKDHVSLLLTSFHRATGKHLLPPELNAVQAAKALFQAPFVVLSHNNADDPIFTYGNQTALELFELDWSELLKLPSRFSAEAPNREERARLLRLVTEHGFIENYQGIRISKTGTRFWIQEATVWNLTDVNDLYLGQAATFSRWDPIT